MPVQYVPLETVKNTMRELGAATQKKINALTDQIQRQERQIGELEHADNEMLEQKKRAEEMKQKRHHEELTEIARKHTVAMKGEKERFDIQMKKEKEKYDADIATEKRRFDNEIKQEKEKRDDIIKKMEAINTAIKDQLVETMHRSPPIRVWVRLTHPQHSKGKIPVNDQQALPYKIKEPRTIELSGQEYTLNHVFGLQESTLDIFNKLEPILDVVQTGNRHLIVMAYGESGSGKSSTLIDGVPMTGKSSTLVHGVQKTAIRDSALFELISNYFFETIKETGDAATLARVTGYQYVCEELRHLNCATKQPVRGQRLGMQIIQSQPVWRYKDSKDTTSKDETMKDKTARDKTMKSKNMIDKPKQDRTMNDPVQCRSTGKVLEAFQEQNELRVRQDVDTKSRSSRDHGWYHLQFSGKSAPKGAVTIFDLAGLEELGAGKDTNTKGEANSLVNALNALKIPLNYLSGGADHEWNPANESNKFIRFITDMLLGQNEYSKYKRPFIVILGHVADTNGQKDKSLKVLERLCGWKDPAADIDVGLDR